MGSGGGGGGILWLCVLLLLLLLLPRRVVGCNRATMRLIGLLPLPLDTMATMGWSTRGISVSTRRKTVCGGGGCTELLSPGVVVVVVVVVVAWAFSHICRSRAKMAAHVARERAGTQKSTNKLSKANVSFSLQHSGSSRSLVPTKNDGRIPCRCKMAQTFDDSVDIDIAPCCSCGGTALATFRAAGLNGSVWPVWVASELWTPGASPLVTPLVALVSWSAVVIAAAAIAAAAASAA
jgi:hypothetical protein